VLTNAACRRTPSVDALPVLLLGPATMILTPYHVEDIKLHGIRHGTLANLKVIIGKGIQQDDREGWNVIEFPAVCMN
jgi:hypothetical protein